MLLFLVPAGRVEGGLSGGPCFSILTLFSQYFFLVLSTGGRIVLRGARKIMLHTIGCKSGTLIISVCASAQKSISFVIQLPGSRGTDIGDILFHPLSVLRVSFRFQRGSTLRRVQSMHFNCACDSLPCRPCGSSVTLFLSRFLYQILGRRSSGTPLFACIICSLR